jgi:argonaute family protein
MSIRQCSKGKDKKLINIFSVDIEQIEKELNNLKEPKVRVYHVKPIEPLEFEPLINILNNNGYYDGKEGKLYTTRKINKLPYEYEKIAELIEENSVTINEVPVNGRKDVIKVYVRDKVKIDTRRILSSIDELDNIKKELPKSAGIQILRSGSTFKIGSWNAKILVDDNDLFVFWKGDALYVAINVSIEINFDGNMWDHLVKRDIRKLERMLGTKFRYILDLEGGRERSRVYIVKNVIPKDEYINMRNERGGLMLSYEDLLKYPERRINEYKENINFGELFKNAKIDGIDNNQAIIEGVDSRGRKFYFPAQYVIPVFDPKIAEDEEREILDKLKKSVHNYKGSLIKKIANKIWYLKDSNENFITSFDDEARLLVKMYNINDNKVYNKEARTTSQIISPLKLLKRYKKKKGINKSEANEIPLPNKVPTILENVKELSLIVLVEEDLKENELNIVNRIVEDFTYLYDFLRKIWEKNGYKLPYITSKKELSFKRNDDFARLASKIFEGPTNGMFYYAFIFGRRSVEREDDEEPDYYEDLKRALFARNIISQNISVENYLSKNGEIDEKELGYAFSNIFYDMLGKLGIKLFTLRINTEYDYIISVDVGEGEAEGSKIVGSIVIFDRSGTLINMIPVYKTSYPGRETARLGDLLKHVDEKGYITFNGKKILLLRDGRLTKEEQDQLKDFSSKKRCTIDVINVKKRTPFQQLSEELSEEYDSIDWYADMGDFYLLKAHKPKAGLARPVKIDRKVVVFNNGQIEEESATLKELKLLRDLAYLNYSTIEGKGGLKIPAPIHYADKLLKALRRGWRVKEDFLNEGMIYFL